MSSRPLEVRAADGEPVDDGLARRLAETAARLGLPRPDARTGDLLARCDPGAVLGDELLEPLARLLGFLAALESLVDVDGDPPAERP